MKPLLPTCLLLALGLCQCVCPSDFRRVEKPRVESVADVDKLSDCQIQHYGTTLLASTGRVDVTRALLARGAQPVGKLIYNGKAEDGSALSGVNDERVLRELLAAGMDANAPVNDLRETPLCNVVKRGSNHLLPLLLAAGSTPNRTNAQGETPLYLAASLMNPEACSLLLQYGAMPDFGHMESGASPLHACLKADAAAREKTEVAQVLLASGANAAHADAEGVSPLHLAPAELVQMLVAAGADVNARDMQGRTPLFHCTTPAQAETLLKAGADLNARDYRGRTAFDTVQNAAVKSYLLARGAASGQTL